MDGEIRQGQYDNKQPPSWFFDFCRWADEFEFSESELSRDFKKVTETSFLFIANDKVTYIPPSFCNLKCIKTLFSNSGRSTSSEVPVEIQKEMGLSPGLVRFSVGLDFDIERTFELIKSCLDELD